MNTLKKCLIGFLVLTVTGMYFPHVSFCDDSGTSMKTITRHDPQIRSTPQEDIALMEIEESDKKGPNWWMIGLGVVVLGGLVAAAGGGGGGGGGEPPPEPGPTDPGGTMVVGW